MSKIKFLFLIITVILIFATAITPVFAHSGRTDSNGGHKDNSTGEYHYHHGHPAHQHPNGKCPYEFSTEQINEETAAKNNNKKFGFVGFLIAAALFGAAALLVYVKWFWESIKFSENQITIAKIVLIVLWVWFTIAFGMNVCF